MARFRLAVREQPGRTTWLGVLAFGEQANAVRGLRKDDRVQIFGRLQLQPWVGQDGKERMGIDLVAQSIDVLEQQAALFEDRPRPVGRGPPGAQVRRDVEIKVVAGAPSNERPPGSERIGLTMSKYTKQDGRKSLYEEVTARIIGLLEQGVIPWHKPWAVYGPVNYVSRRPYRGINLLLLDVGEYLTYLQAEGCGGHVKKGARAHRVVYYKPLVGPDSANGEEEAGAEDEGVGCPDGGPTAAGSARRRRHCVLRWHYVFALADCEGIPSKLTLPDLAEHQPLATAQALIDGYAGGPTLETTRSNHARYFPQTDRIRMPLLGQFETPEDYYSTLFHEEVHGTGHPTRLARFSGGSRPFRGERYSKEELIAEIGAAMLCAQVGIAQRTIQKSASYIQGWLACLRDDQTLIISAASKAQKAVDWILARPADGRREEGPAGGVVTQYELSTTGKER
jgi:antirestriction protein ArdC